MTPRDADHKSNQHNPKNPACRSSWQLPAAPMKKQSLSARTKRSANQCGRHRGRRP